METIDQLIGQGKDLTTLQMCVRAFLTFIIAFILLRISGRRSFGMHSPLDNIIVILLGATLSRAVVGASPFIPVVGASITLVILHRLFGWLMSISPTFGKVTQGEKITLYEDGRFLDRNMRRSMVCKEEIMFAVRQSLNSEDLELVDTIYIERNGEVNIIKK